MAIAGNSVSTNLTSGTVQQLFKKAETGLLTALQAESPEFGWYRKMKMTPGLFPSALEMRVILNVMFSKTGAMINEGGYEATTDVPTVQNGTQSLVQFNGRFALSGLGRLYDRFASNSTVSKLNLYAAAKVLEGMGRKYAYQYYGYSTGTVAVVDTTVAVTTTDVLLKQAFGSSLIGNTNATATASQLKYMAQLFRGLDVVAPIHAGGVVANGQGVVNSVNNAAGSINITTPGSATFTAGDPLVFFNTVTDTTVAGTELNLWTAGLLGMSQPASYMGLSSSTAPNWSSYTDSSGGRFGPTKYWDGQQYLQNYAGTQGDILHISNGVMNDARAAERASKVYMNTNAFDLDGNLSAKGVEVRTSLLTPPGMAFLYDSDIITKVELGDLPSEKGSPDLFEVDKLPNQNIYASSLTHARCVINTNRAGLYVYSGLNEQ